MELHLKNTEILLKQLESFGIKKNIFMQSDNGRNNTLTGASRCTVCHCGEDAQ